MVGNHHAALLEVQWLHMAATRKSAKAADAELLDADIANGGADSAPPNESGLRPKVTDGTSLLNEESRLRLTLAQRELQLEHLRRELDSHVRRLEAQRRELKQAERCQMELSRQLRLAVSQRDATIRALEEQLRELRQSMLVD